jgi:8-oxo-dGTP pyrophosphatase MutT (NUDIX family)
MLRRSEKAAFMGGAYVFPGGRVDPADAASADPSWCEGLETAALPTLARDVAIAHRLAAIRELFEEAGLLLAYNASGALVSLADPIARDRLAHDRLAIHAGTIGLKAVATRESVRLALDALVPFARWKTPPIDTRQFDAWFFMTRVPPGQMAVADDLETTQGVWLTPSAAIALAQGREIVLPVPTWTTLRELEIFSTVDAALAWARPRQIVGREPRLHTLEGDQFLLLPGDPLNVDPWHEPLPRETRFRFTSGYWKAERAPDLDRG